jgi:hypothetical protein
MGFRKAEWGLAVVVVVDGGGSRWAGWGVDLACSSNEKYIAGSAYEVHSFNHNVCYV